MPKGLRNHETSALLTLMQRHAPEAFRALLLWVEGRGTRGEQAASLSIHVNTYRSRVEQAYAWLEVASRNVARHGMQDRLRLLQGDALEPVRGERARVIAAQALVREQARDHRAAIAQVSCPSMNDLAWRNLALSG